MRYDERDTVFSRLLLKIGSNEFDEYYSQNPGNKQCDMNLKMKKKEKMAKSAGISNGKSKGILFMGKSEEKSQNKSIMSIDPNSSDHEYAAFRLMVEYQRLASSINDEALNMDVNPTKRNIPPETMSVLVKEFLKLSGLDAVGVAEIGPDDLYSHRGFSTELHKYGDEINLDYKYAIVFAVPLEKDYINRAPSKELFMSAMLGYAKSSEVAARLAMYIKDLGFDALTDSSFTYHSPISFLAEKAGLGQMGRCNSVVNPKYGNRTKLAAVLTNLPLAADGKIDFGLKEFCELCRRCENNCPVKAIASESSTSENGEKYWKHNHISCMEMWINSGNSCGICMSACPFSQGTDEELVSRMKDSPGVMAEILEKHSEKYGKRNYIKEPLDFMPPK
ncbi:4Fe-4S dicluster domain-containing protein [Peptoclostridium litorale DSM 5388]|uniref:3-chloro-4-hydroxyphenylacetate reductive dehalogenase CprA n=1 Tax=Peptoclostridium litorale DSM 5388 TaxID=1121324 RepID=A0A069RFR0_PEPLI|nr:reductive dehalogenase domain-containing protein [Peptoclostridium litorale]KDR95884.1 3-chloro-4-hydroxyphenylacetate reductive dehalogenase CprA [Peptoclostridium litorale DSM 5388]SIO10712.1 4Fe-4S dicluster domain-containing protein [Peptoclostridium litorale DSM 5388]